MSFIPYESQVDVRTGNTNTPRIRNSFTAESFGAGQARALGDAAQAVGEAGDALRDERQRKEREQTLYNVATADYTPIENELQKTMSPDGEGYVDAIKTSYPNWVEEQTNNIDDDNVRQATKNELLARLPSYINRANTMQQAAVLANSKQNVNTILSTQQNRVLSDPSAYDNAVAYAKEAIDLYAGDIPAAQREAMKVQSEYNINKTYFDGRIMKAQTPSELDAVEAELQTTDWQSKLQSTDYADVSDTITATRRSYATQINAEVKASLKTMEAQSKDVTALIPQDEMQAVAQKVKQYGDSAAQVKFAKLARRQQTLKTARKLNPTQLVATINEKKTKNTQEGSNQLFPAANAAVRLVGGSPNLLLAISGNEWSATGPDKNPSSSAAGPMQFMGGTQGPNSAFYQIVKNNPTMFGVRDDTSDDAILKLRSNRDAAMLAGAILIKQNKAALESMLGRTATDAEVLMAHRLGAAGYARMNEAFQTNPQAPAKNYVPQEQYEPNKVMYTNKNTGKDYTVAEFISNHEEMMETPVGGADFEDVKVLEDVLDAQRRAVSEGTILDYAASTGVTMLTPLDQPGAFAARAREADRTSNYYGVEVKPFTRDDQPYISQKLNSNNVDEQLDTLSNISTMGPRYAAAGLKQINDTNPAAAQAGRLVLMRDRATAQAVLKGTLRIKENPSIVSGVKFSAEASSSLFENEVSQAFSRLPSQERESMKRAADAYYIETLASTGGEFKDSEYQKVIEKVSGYRFARVNGFKTALPRDVNDGDINTFLDKADAADIMAAAVSGQRPKAQIGVGSTLRLKTDPIEDILPDARLVLVGNDTYRLYPPSGAVPYTTGESQNGVYQPYDIKLTRDILDSVKQRKQKFASVKPVPKAEVR